MENTNESLSSSQPRSLPLFYHTILEQLELDIPYPNRIHEAECALEKATEEISNYENQTNRNLEKIQSLTKRIAQEESSLNELNVDLSKIEQQYAVEQQRDYKYQIQSLTKQKEEKLNAINSFRSQLIEEETKTFEKPNSQTYSSVQNLKQFIQAFDLNNQEDPDPEPFHAASLDLETYSTLLSRLNKTFLIKDYYYFIDSMFVHPRYFPSAQTHYKQNLGFKGEKAFALELWLLLTNPETKAYMAWGETYIDLHRDYFCIVKALTLTQPQPPGISFGLSLFENSGESSELRRQATKQEFQAPIGFVILDGQTLYTHRFVLKQFGKTR